MLLSPQPLCPSAFMSAGHGTSITLTAYVSGGGPSSAAAFVEANPAPPPAGPNTLDTILILRLEDGADIFISLRGTFLPSCYGMDLDRWVLLSMVMWASNSAQQRHRQGIRQTAAEGAAG